MPREVVKSSMEDKAGRSKQEIEKDMEDKEKRNEKAMGDRDSKKRG